MLKIENKNIRFILRKKIRDDVQQSIFESTSLRELSEYEGYFFSHSNYNDSLDLFSILRDFQQKRTVETQDHKLLSIRL